MGTFVGHLLPGVLFVVFSTWWLTGVLNGYFKSLYRQLSGVTSQRRSGQFNGHAHQNRLLQGTVAIVVAAVGIAGEYVTAFQDGVFQMNNGQHMTMYSAFLLYGATEVMVKHNCPLPPGVRDICLVVAYGTECLLLYFHLHGKSHLEVQLHFLLLISCFLALTGAILEPFYPYSPGVAIWRPLFSFIMGTWFIQIGFILYNPFYLTQWSNHDHRQLMIITVLFCWHILGAILFVLYLSRRCAKKMAPNLIKMNPTDNVHDIGINYTQCPVDES
ncbi:Transmembrane protein 45B [Halotydeus destructor]|nr:Transmembrane protein 45B [Halotydeus destructor]